jgi:cytochrome c55X
MQPSNQKVEQMVKRGKPKPFASALALSVLLSVPLPLQAQRQGPSQSFEPGPDRQQALLRMLRQDCGSCHGMRLTGGLGPALQPQAMRQLPRSSIAAVIYHGRPGTPMPGWKTMLSADEAEWLAGVLQGDTAAAVQESKP